MQSKAQISDFEVVDFKKADSIALSYSDEELTNLPELSHKLTSNLNTDAERFRAIYRWVCGNIANDYGLYLKNKYKRQRFKDDSLKFHTWNAEFRRALFKKLRKKKRTICTGYAYLVKELAQFANIECEIVQGYGRVSTTNIENLKLPNHSWNAVKLSGKWYLCDPTWASGTPDPETKKFAFNYNNGFFLTNPQLFAVNHFPIDDKWWLLEKSIPSFEEFLASPIIYGKAYKNLIVHTSPKQMHHTIKKHRKISFEYQLKIQIKENDIHFLMDNGYNSKKVKPTRAQVKKNTLLIEHQFNSVGFFDVHLFIGEDLISTYTVDVNKL